MAVLNQIELPDGTIYDVEDINSKDFVKEEDFEILTETGNSVSVTTKAEGYAKSALVTFAPKQSGTGDPSPENIRPISGWDSLSLMRTGKNFWRYGNVSGTKLVDKNVSIPEGTWTFSCEITSADVDGTESLIIFHYDDETTFNTRLDRNGRVSYTFISTNPINQISFYAGYNSSQSSGDAFTYSNIQLELGSTATTCEPYQGETYTATFPNTVYGGSYDFVSGKLIITHAIADLSLLNWSTRYTEDVNKTLSTADVTGYKYIQDTPVINEYYPHNGTTSAVVNLQHPDQKNVGTYFFYTSSQTQNYLYLVLPKSDSPQGKICYELETPTEITLTPADVNLIKGLNTVYTDGDTVQIKYSKIPNGTPRSVKVYYQNGNLFIY